MTTLLIASLLLPVSAGAADPSPGDQKVVEVYEAVVRLAAGLKDQVWPGYDPRKYTTLVTDPKTGQKVLRISPDPKSERPVIIITLNAAWFREHTAEENVLLVFHEAFHAFEHDPARPGVRWRFENTLHLFDYAALPARNNALFAIEGQLLHAALEAGTAEDARQKVRSFLAIRGLRQADLDEALIAFEKGAESNEGLAEYAGAKAVVAGMEAVKAKRVAAAFSFTDGPRYLREKYQKLTSLTRIGNNDRLKFYYTGSAQGLLLDRLSPGWKERLQQKAAAVQDLLAEAVGGVPGRKEAEAALRTYGYEKVLEQEQEQARRRLAAGEALLASALAQKGRRITIDLSALGRMGDYAGFDPMNVTVLDAERRLHTRMVNFAQKDLYRAEFTQPALEDRGKKQYVAVVKDEGRQTATLDGAPLPLDRPARKPIEKKLVITAPGFRLEAEAGEVEVTKDGVVVRFQKRAKE
jgi:hypothetical protein